MNHRRCIASLALALGLGWFTPRAEAQHLNLAERRATLPARKDPRIKGHDLAAERADAALLWSGGEAGPDYLDFKARQSRREILRWKLAAGLAQPSAQLAAPAWSSLGPFANLTTTSYPDIDSGRPNSIVTHPSNPSLVYLASSTGGVFRCNNADPGASGDWIWTSITDALPASSSSGNIPVGAMAMSPADPNTLYIGLGDFVDDAGRGFYRSTDGGSTWTEATGLGSATRTTFVLPLSASVVLWGTNDGLKRSTDGGLTFSPVSMGGSGTWVWGAVAFSPTEVALVRAELRSGYRWSFQSGTALWSSDAGATWSPASVTGISGFGRVSLAAAPGSSTGWGLAEATSPTASFHRGVLKTTDKGHTWTFIPAPVVSGGLFMGIGSQMTGDGGQAGYNQVLAVNPDNPDQLFAGANLALYRSDDGGLSWVQLTHWYGNRHVYAHADFHCATWSKTGAPTLFVGSDGGISVIRNPVLAAAAIPTGAASVPSDVNFIDNRRNKGLAAHQIYHLGSTTAATPADSRHRISLGLQDNGTRVRQDTGGGLQNSTTYEDQIGGDGFGTLIHPLNGNLILGSYYYTNVQKSTNGGVTAFANATSGIAEAGSSTDAPFYTRLAPGEADPTGNTVYTFTNKVVYKSANFGSLWAPLGMSGFNAAYTIRQINAARTDPNTVAVVTSASAGFKTTNGGSSWTAFGAFPNSGSSLSYIWFDTENAQTLYAASVAVSATSNHLWKSTDGGNTWAAIDGNSGFPSGIPVHVIKNVPGASATLFAGTDFGVYRSTDAGASWARYGQGLPLVSVRDLYLAPDGTFLRVATYGRGVWEAPLAAAPAGPTITTHPASQAVTVGQTATFSVAATTSGGSLSYQWKKNGANVGTSASSYTTPPTVVGDNGTQFSVAVSDANGTTISNAATLTVTAMTPVVVTVSPKPVTLLTGAQAVLTAVVTGNANTAVSWSGSGALFLSSLSANTTTFTAGAAGSYLVTATSAADASKADSATITVKTRDFNSDSFIDVMDLALFAQAFGTTSTIFNLDGIGIVDDTDLTLFLTGF